MAEGFEKQSGMKNQEGAGKGRSRGQAVNFLFTMLLFLGVYWWCCGTACILWC